MNINNLKTLKVHSNTKCAVHKWKDGIGCSTGKPKDHKNYGILTGKINNIIVIDCDFYKVQKDEYKILEILNDYKNNILNTYTVKTPRGGLHYYFIYDDALITTSNDKYNIDVRSDGAYIIGEGSSIDGKYYEVVHDVKPAKINDDVKKWLMCNLYTAEKKREILNKNKNKKTKTPDNNINYECSYNLTNEDLKNIINDLGDEYWTMENSGFLKFTTFCKYFNIFDLWDTINKSKPNYNYNKNVTQFWETCNINNNNIYSIIDNVLYDAGNKTNVYIAYSKYRPTPINIIKADKTITQEYLSLDLINESKSYMIKSDTGTGKTTLFKEYIKMENKNFISIVSRVSLANEQYRIFNEHGIDDIKHYTIDTCSNLQNYNVVIQVDSIFKLGRLNFSDYIIFLDEINSIIHHLIMSPTLNNKRALIMNLFIRILREAKQVICTDADINDVTLNFIKPYRKYTYINNTIKHNKDVKTTEIKNFKLFIEKLKLENKYIVACDSATIADTLYLEMTKDLIINTNTNDKDIIKLITSATKQDDLNLDDHNKIIFSPKILYGLDSTMERPVYCYYKEHTINPVSFIQQICRCRNITHLYYTFEKKEYTNIKTTREDLINKLSDQNIIINKLYELEVLMLEKDYRHFLKCYIDYEYINICYDTNKFSHFLKLMNERGFKINNIKILDDDKKGKKEKKEKIKQMKKNKEDVFNIDNHIKVNEYLNIPKTEHKIIDIYKKYYIDPYLLQEHKNIINTVERTEEFIKNKIEQTKGTQNNIINSTNHKILLLKKIKKIYNIDDFKNIEINEEDFKKVENHKNILLYEEFIKTYKLKSINDFNNIDNINKSILKMYKHLYGSIIEKTKINKRIKETGKIKTMYIYKFNDEYLKFNLELYEYRKNKSNKVIRHKLF